MLCGVSPCSSQKNHDLSYQHNRDAQLVLSFQVSFGNPTYPYSKCRRWWWLWRCSRAKEPGMACLIAVGSWSVRRSKEEKNVWRFPMILITAEIWPELIAHTRMPRHASMCCPWKIVVSGGTEVETFSSKDLAIDSRLMPSWVISNPCGARERTLDTSTSYKLMYCLYACVKWVVYSDTKLCVTKTLEPTYKATMGVDPAEFFRAPARLPVRTWYVLISDGDDEPALVSKQPGNSSGLECHAILLSVTVGEPPRRSVQ